MSLTKQRKINMAGGGRRRNKNEMVGHFVWTTQDRRPCITPAIERAIYRCIVQEARERRCKVLAINGLPDHVHLVLVLSATTSISDLMKQVKGASSALARNLLGPDEYFRWEDHYAAFAVSGAQVRRVVLYVQEQKVRHASGEVWPDWEETTWEDGEQKQYEEYEEPKVSGT